MTGTITFLPTQYWFNELNPKLLKLFVGLIEVRKTCGKEKYKFYQIKKENNVAEAEKKSQQTVASNWTVYRVPLYGT